jgi:TolB-like protein
MADALVRLAGAAREAGSSAAAGAPAGAASEPTRRDGAPGVDDTMTAAPRVITGREPRSRETTPLTMPERPSIAVLPFRNMSGDPEQDYFADGMVEDLITALSRLRWLFVIARQSTFVYKGRTVDVRQVGRELGVRYVLEGSVRKSGQRVRITGQLLEAASGAQLWAERYDGALADVFDLQDRITESVIGALEPSVRQAEIERARRKPPENLDAYDLLLRALPFTDGHSPATTNQALPWLERALALDASYALAHAYAGWCLEQRYLRGGFDPADRVAALHHAREALSQGREDATALALGGFVVQMLDPDAHGSLDAFDDALALNPSSALAYALSAVVRVFQGDFARGIEHAERSIRLSPLDPARAMAWIAIGNAHLFSGRYAEAAAAAEKGAHANPRFPVAQLILAAARIGLGQESGARAAMTRLLELEPGFKAPGYERTVVMAGGRPEWGTAVTAALRKAGAPG